ncbi:MAG: hypothetical protein PHO02_00115 [Candidatus Nanoarchaeia archaeon]|nr:hypothetical protein [Candidatus Nanoarchaeia archaeon]
MSYLAELLACRRVKDSVKLYVDVSAQDEYDKAGCRFAEEAFFKLEKEHLAYLGTTGAFAGAETLYADENPDKAIIAHEQWHNTVSALGLVSPAGDFIEEATATVIETVIGGYGKRYLGLSSSFIQTQLLVQNCGEEELEKVLDRFSQNIIPQWDEAVFSDSSPWLRFIEDGKYLLLYDLCFDICANRGIRASKGIYKTALKKAKRKGFDAGLRHLQEYASPAIARLYDFEFDVGNYFPEYPELMNRSFFEGKLKIEAYGTYKTWLEPLEVLIRKLQFREDS